MNNANHGGARPKVRDDDGRGKHHSPKPGSGRPPQSFTFKVGQRLFVGVHDKDGNGWPDESDWTVTEIDRTHIIFTSASGMTYRVHR